MKNYKVIAVNEEIMKTASDTFFRQFVEWMNSENIENADSLQDAAEVVRNEFMQKGDWYNALVASILGYLQETDGSIPYDQMAVELANRIVGIELDSSEEPKCVPEESYENIKMNMSFEKRGIHG